MTSELLRTPAGLRNEAARLRRLAYQPHLTYPEREALLREATKLEHRAERLEPPRDVKPPPSPPSPPSPQERIARALPPLPQPNAFHVTPPQAKRFREKAHSASLAAEAAERSHDLNTAEALRRSARAWTMMSEGLMPPGWTPDGPIGKSRGHQGRGTGGHVPPPLPPISNILAELGGRLLEFACHCGKTRQIPAAYLAGQLDPGARLADAVKRLKCADCGGRPSSVKVLPL